MYTPKEVAENYLSTCRVKAALPLGRMFLLACLAGAFVALAGVASTAAAATVGDPSLAKLVSGCVFPAGLAMVIVAGSELFTGNNLMIMGVLSRVISARRMLRNWGVVYLGNFVGAVLVAALCVLGHVFAAFDGRLAASVISIAQAKASLSFGDAFVRGILCNFLVCIAVWMASAAKSVPGKILAVFFPIMTFVVAGFEHSLRQAIALDPENITVHTLTLKRASRIVIEDQKENDYADVAAMLEKCHLLAEAGYRPYYLYRQKNTLQNLENVGWCKPGHEGYYNIYIMEEVQTILSAGAGGSTKLVADGGKRMQRIFNFKYPNEYIQRFAEVLERKKGVAEFYDHDLGTETTG